MVIRRAGEREFEVDMTPNEVRFQIKRQDGPRSTPYWENFKMPYAPGHNVVSAHRAF